MKCISPTTIILHDILHTGYLGMHKRLTDWVTFSLKQHSSIDKFNWLWVMMPPYPGFARFNKPYSQATKSRHKQMNTLRCRSTRVVPVTLSNPFASQRIPFTDSQLSVKDLLHFHLVEQYQYDTKATIEYM